MTISRDAELQIRISVEREIGAMSLDAREKRLLDLAPNFKITESDHSHPDGRPISGLKASWSAPHPSACVIDSRSDLARARLILCVLSRLLRASRLAAERGVS